MVEPETTVHHEDGNAFTEVGRFIEKGPHGLATRPRVPTPGA